MQRFFQWLSSPPGRGVLKCTIAYTIASLGTFAPPLASFLGAPGGKHVVATMTVYFHPARTAGSMVEAVLIAVVAVAYAELVSLLSMATSVLFGAAWGQVTLAHVLVVVVFVGGGFGFIGWVKQRMENPLVNVASTLASLAIISVVTKENAVVDNVFSNQKIIQVLKMLVMGITTTAAVNLLIWRVSARALLRGSMAKVSASLAEMLSLISAGYLAGSEDDVALEEFSAASSAYASLHPQMMKNLREAKFEHYLVGGEILYAGERSVAVSMEALAQSAGGLRSASSTLFALLQLPVEIPTRRGSDDLERSSTVQDSEQTTPASDVSSFTQTASCTPTQFFGIFATTLRDTMSSLVAELCNVLRESQFGETRTGETGGSPGQSSDNLTEALGRFKSARSDALQLLYDHSALRESSSIEVQANLEQVAAACGHFTSSLQSFAEEVQEHINLLDELSQIASDGKRSWRWARWWKKGAMKSLRLASLEEEGLIRPIRKHATPKGIPDSMARSRDTYGWDAAPGASRILGIVSQKILTFFRKLARDDILFGLKVGIGASLWAMLAFLEATRDIYSHYRGEWGLLSFMIVCSMTVGASNTTGSSRFVGTLLGAVFSFVNWNVSRGNAFALMFLGWLVSFWNFYLIVAGGRAPLGRMTQLAYNVSVLYAYSLEAGSDNDDGDDEGGSGKANMTEIVKHRVLSVTCGILWGLIICRGIWPISARRKFKEGISVLCLQMGLIWKRGPLAILLRSDNSQSYLRSGEQAAMQRYAGRLESLRQSASSEFELRGPFPFASSGRILRSAKRILDSFYAMSLVTQRSGHLTDGEKALLRYTAPERAVLCDRICHIFQVIASSMMLEYPLTNAVPNIISLRNNLLRKVFEFREAHADASQEQGQPAEEKDYALMYAYVLVTGQVADELKVFEREIQDLYGVLDEDSVLLE